VTAPRQPGVAKTAPKNRPAKISPARKAAFNVLLAIDRGHAHSDDLLRDKAVNALSSADRNLATALVLGVLRWQIRLDHQLQSLLKHPNAKLESEIRIALRMGAFQILHMDRIPARAAIDESVELAKQAGHRFASGMVNAVLRKLAVGVQHRLEPFGLKGHGLSRAEASSVKDVALAAEGTQMLRDKFPPGLKPSPPPEPALGTAEAVPFQNRESAAELALAEAHPEWMVERWIDLYGLDAARAICKHGQTQPIHNLHLVSSRAETELTQAAIVLDSGQLLTSSRTVVSGDVSATAAFKGDRVRMQDEGSQLVAEVAAANLNPGDGEILDACAAPGGKTLILAERNPQAHILACESSPSRLEQMCQRLAAHAGRIEFRLADATKLAEDAAFDLVLADVPCSGTGTLGRNPEIRHRLGPEDLARQAERQRAILAAALRAVRTGGRVVYSTCSLEPEENEQVVAAVLAATPNSKAISLHASIDLLQSRSILASGGAALLKASLTAEGSLRLIPGVSHTDGFFIALIERIG
jgi:16S rRNA (cytosine967-C5)-methyltransferase